MGDTSQTYGFTYDAFGNMTAVHVGNTSLASYTYAEGNGPLLQQTYANGDTITFTYDYLGRIKTETLDDGRVVTYTYNGEGQLYCVKETSGTTVTAYYYTYDSNGRLVSSEMRNTTGQSLMRVNLCYNQAGQLVGQTWNIGGTEYTEGYTYNAADGTLNTFTAGTGDTLTMHYDSLRRVNVVSSDRGNKQYTYRRVDGKNTTQVSTIQRTDIGGGLYYSYIYDAMGNITRQGYGNGYAVDYTYDSQGQLLSASDGSSYVYNYTYDSAGNILTANNHTYTYGNTAWPDLLTAFDGETITYDTSGNPLSYYNGTRWTFAWENGRSLATATDGTTNISYTYDASGLRTSKTVDGVVHHYYYAGGKLLRETYGDNVLDFFYDENGHPYAFKYNGTLYYYITNLQGDVEYIVNSSRSVVGGYAYDPYGNIVSSISSTIGNINPLRYRGYYFDSDSGLYYLQSRYYDPAIGRFINADVYTSTGQGTLGNNMFAYCNNNPVNRIDASGSVSLWYFLIVEHDMGFIHRAVQAHIMGNYGATTEFSILGGRADIIKNNAVWEVKHASTTPALRIEIAQKQAGKYVDGESITGLGSAGAFSGNFYIQCGKYSYYIEYSTPADGAILYTVKEVQNYNGDYFRKFLTKEEKKANQQMMAMPNYSAHITYFAGGGGGGMGVMIAVGALACVGCCLLRSWNYG